MILFLFKLKMTLLLQHITLFLTNVSPFIFIIFYYHLTIWTIKM